MFHIFSYRFVTAQLQKTRITSINTAKSTASPQSLSPYVLWLWAAHSSVHPSSAVKYGIKAILGLLSFVVGWIGNDGAWFSPCCSPAGWILSTEHRHCCWWRKKGSSKLVGLWSHEKENKQTNKQKNGWGGGVELQGDPDQPYRILTFFNLSVKPLFTETWTGAGKRKAHRRDGKGKGVQRWKRRVVISCIAENR